MIASSQMQGGMTDPARRVILLLEKMNVIKQIVLHNHVIIQVDIDAGFPLRIEKHNDLITFSEIREDELEGIITMGSVTFSIHASGLLTLIGTVSVESGEVVEGNDSYYAQNFCRDLLDSGYEQGKITWIKPEGMFEPVQFTRNTSVEIIYTVDPGKVYGSHYQETICIEPLLPSMLTSEKIFTTEEGHVTDKVWLLKREFLPEALDQSIRATKQVEQYRSTEALWKACKGERTPLFFMFALKSSYLKNRQQEGKNVLVCLAGKRLVPINADVTAWMLRNIPDMELVCYGNNNFAAIESAGQIVGFLQFMNIQGLENIEFVKAKEKPAKEPVATVEKSEAPALLETEGLDVQAETQEHVVLSDAEKALAHRTWTLRELIGLLDDYLLDGKKLSKKEASELVRNIAKAKAASLGKKSNWDMDKAVFKNLVRWILEDQAKQQGPTVQPVLTQEPYMVPFESFVMADSECFKAGEALRKAEDELLYVERFNKTSKSALKNAQTEQKRALQRVSMERHGAKMRHRKLIEEAIQQYEGLEIPLEVLSPYVEDSEIIKAYLVRKESADGSMAGPQEIEEVTLTGNLEAPEQVERFQVGNRVQIAQAIGLSHLAGQTGIIAAVDTTSGIAYLVKLYAGQLIDPFDESLYDPVVHDEFLVLLGEDALSVKTPQLDAVASAPEAIPEEPKALKIGDRVEITGGLFQGRHGTITEFGKPLAMIGENSRTVNTCQIRTDNGAVVNQTEAILGKETQPPVNVLPDIQVDQDFFTPEAIYMVLLTIEKRVLDYKARAASEKDPSKKAECDNLIKTASLKGKELADLFRKWGAQYPEQAKEIISKCKEEYAARKTAEEHKLQKPESKLQQQTPPAQKKASTYYDSHFKRRGWSSVGGMTPYEQKMMR